MNKSKLQISVEILCSLSSNGPMSVTQINDRVELDKYRLGVHLNLLYDSGLVGEQYLGEGKKAFTVTDRGLSVLKVIGPMVKEAHRIQMHNYEAISNALSGTSTSDQIKNKPKRRIKDFIRKKRPKWKLSNLIKIEIAETKD